MCLQFAAPDHVCVRPDVRAAPMSLVPLVVSMAVLRPVLHARLSSSLVPSPKPLPLSVFATVIGRVMSTRPRVNSAVCALRFSFGSTMVSAASDSPGDRAGRVAVLPVVAARPLERLVVRHVFAHFSVRLVPELSQTSSGQQC